MFLTLILNNQFSDAFEVDILVMNLGLLSIINVFPLIRYSTIVSVTNHQKSPTTKSYI